MNNFWNESKKVNLSDFESLSEEMKNAIAYNLKLFYMWENIPVSKVRFKRNKLYLKMYCK